MSHNRLITPTPVTWLLPVRNAMPYLTEALLSIAAQTYRNHRVLAWDNGSTDGSLEELRRWIPSRVDGVVTHGRPLPLGSCLANLVQLAPTDLCARFDADDVNEPTRLAEQVAFLTTNPGVDLVGCNVRRMNAAEDEIDVTHVPIADSDIRWRLRFCNAVNHPTVLFRRSAILAAGNYRDMTPGQDYDLWVRLASRCVMANLPAALVRYRVHAGSVSAGKTTPDHVRHEKVAAEHAASLFPHLPAEMALELRRILVEERTDLIAPRHVRLLRKVAVEAARAAAQPDDYFTRTRLYRDQRRYLALSLIKRNPLVRAALTAIRRRRTDAVRETTQPIAKATFESQPPTAAPRPPSQRNAA